jgi:hypothetical protein
VQRRDRRGAAETLSDPCSAVVLCEIRPRLEDRIDEGRQHKRPRRPKGLSNAREQAKEAVSLVESGSYDCEHARHSSTRQR